MTFSAELYQTESFDDLWAFVLKPWFESIQGKGFEHKPSAILLPYSSWEARIKHSMAECSLSGFNIHFLTPGKVRHLIHDAFPSIQPKASMEGVQCVAAALAYKNECSYSKSIYFSPESFVRAYGKYIVGGYPLSEFLPNSLNTWSKNWEKAVSQLGLIQQSDREALIALMRQKHIIFDELFIAGFTGRDWGLYPFLLGALCLAQTTKMSLPLVRDGMHEELWQGTWEHLIGNATPVRGEIEKSSENIPCEAEFLLSRTIIQEAECISKKALLAAASGEFVSIVVPCSGGLSREISRCLEEWGVEHYSSFSNKREIAPQERLFDAWLQFAKECTLDSFLNLLRESKDFGEDLILGLKDVLERAFCDLLTNDIRLLRAYIFKECAISEKMRQALDFFQTPNAEDTFSNYLNWVQPIVERCFEEKDFLGEGEILGSILEGVIPLTLFLGWVESVAKKGSSIRNACANQPFSNIYLLSAEQADGLSFDTVILAGLNAGKWSKRPSVSLFEPETLINLKNRKNTIQGNQGEGHRVLRFPYSYVLTGEDELREARSRQERLAQSAGKKTIFSASVASEGDFKVNQPLDDFFQFHYKNVHGDYLRELNVPGLVQKTEVILGKDSSLKKKDFPLTLFAYQARRNTGTPFGPYEYTFNPSEIPYFLLSCSQWERAIKNPSDIWYTVLANAKAGREHTAASMRNQARGVWVHRWLVFFKNNAELKALPLEELWRACIEEEAEQFREAVADAYRSSDKSVPDWWDAEWYRAKKNALMLMNRVLSVKDYPFFAQEFSLPDSTQIVFPSKKSISLSGRMDLILSNCDGNFNRLEECAADFLVIDFKTGLQTSLSTKKLEKGEGLQLALYARALKTLGAASVGVSVFGTQGSIKKEPQLTLEDVSQLEGVWGFMEKVQLCGILGQRNQIRGRFGAGSCFPIATLEISKAVLDSKWRAAHPNLCS